jgi:uncharacterized protein YegP (UPF0339 family)
MKFVEYRDRNRQWRWRFVRRNGRKLANSGEGYKRRIDMRKALRTMTESIRMGEYFTEVQGK